MDIPDSMLHKAPQMFVVLPRQHSIKWYKADLLKLCQTSPILLLGVKVPAPTVWIIGYLPLHMPTWTEIITLVLVVPVSMRVGAVI